MNKSKQNIIILFFFILSSCGGLDKSDRIVRRHDFFNRWFSKQELRASINWKMGSDILVLRKNKTFRYYSKVLGISNSGYYSGTYNRFNDSISFEFLLNHKPSFFSSDTLVFDIMDKWMILRTIKKDTLPNSHLIIYENNLK